MSTSMILTLVSLLVKIIMGVVVNVADLSGLPGWLQLILGWLS